MFYITQGQELVYYSCYLC